MKITINEITLTNFKGIQNKTISFNENTRILGANATGKTTVFDAFLWLLFGKDSTDRKEFQIKPLDSNNQPKHKVECEVSGTFDIDGTKIEVKRTFREKWVKKRGEMETTFSGNESLFHYNGVPVSASEYKTKVATLVDESLFKLITNPLYFNSLGWQKRREVLFNIAGGTVSDQEVGSMKPEFEQLLSMLNSNKTLEEYKREISSKRKKLNEEIKGIPTRIDELDRSLPEVHDFTAIENEIETEKGKIVTLDNQISDRSKAYDKQSEKQLEHARQVGDLKLKIQGFESEAKSQSEAGSRERQTEISTVKNILSRYQRELQSTESSVKSKRTEANSLRKESEDLRSKWHKENEKELSFNDQDFCCPTCKRKFEESDVAKKQEELTANFNQNKKTTLEMITGKGKRINKDIELLEESIKAIELRITELKGLIQTEEGKLKDLENGSIESTPIEEILLHNEAYQTAKSDLETLEANPVTIEPINTEDLTSQKRGIQEKIDSLKSKLQNREIIARTKKRMEELQNSESQLAQDIADLEQQQFTIENFNKTKITAIENKINSKFELVKFKMFETQINGGEIECCETLIDGVPFQDANNASRINAGLDIIKSLSSHHDVYAPIFIDNRESVTDIVDTQCQVVSLVVDPSQKELKIA